METSKDRLQEIIKEYSTLNSNDDELITDVVGSIQRKIQIITRMGQTYEEELLIHSELTSRHKENLVMFEYNRYTEYILQHNLEPLPYAMFKNPKNTLGGKQLRKFYNSIKDTDLAIGMEVDFKNDVTYITRINRDCSVSLNGYPGTNDAYHITPCEYEYNEDTKDCVKVD